MDTILSISPFRDLTYNRKLLKFLLLYEWQAREKYKNDEKRKKEIFPRH